MTESVQNMKAFILDRSYRKTRRDARPDMSAAAAGKDKWELCHLFLDRMLTFEEPRFYPNDIFGFYRSFTGYAVCEADGVSLYSHRVSNITVNFSLLMDRGFADVLADIERRLPSADADQRGFLSSAAEILRSALAFTQRYQEAAKAAGNTRLAEALNRVPRKKPTTFYEACLFQKILIFLLRVSKHVHITLGRFDQYMYPYFQADLDRGVPESELLETLELYFLALNVDADTYEGVQQGDNGQSMVLGGFDADGNSQFNALSRLCMEASLELGVIDPKINLRVGKNTPDELYALGTKLTKKGLGFPQYCNDDIVIPGLVQLGYDYEDALDYAVAACWEFTIPGKAMDIPNEDVFNFPLLVSNTVRDKLLESETFEALMSHLADAIAVEAARIVAIHSESAQKRGYPTLPSPLVSLMTDGCLESGLDISRYGAKYYCLGCHGAGISTAADSLAAVKKVIYDEKSVTKGTLLTALAQNFDGYAPLRNRLLTCPKMGSDDDYVDSIAGHLMQLFADSLAGKPSGRSDGFWRAGTGSAMEYIWSASKVPATPDGRFAGEPYGCSYSPSLQAKLAGPLSVIRSFTKFDLRKTINGGPLTMELHDNVFRNSQGEEKVAQLVKLFVLSGGHQLQLNAINRDRLLDAQAHPDKYPNLVVRVWGWSGYFRELDPKFQNHIIRRAEFNL